MLFNVFIFHFVPLHTNIKGQRKMDFYFIIPVTNSELACSHCTAKFWGGKLGRSWNFVMWEITNKLCVNRERTLALLFSFVARKIKYCSSSQWNKVAIYSRLIDGYFYRRGSLNYYHYINLSKYVLFARRKF